MSWGGHGQWRGGIALLAAFVLPASAASASTIKVTTTSDVGAVNAGDCATTDHSCSLREAVAAASSGSIVSLPPGKYLLTQNAGLTISTNISLVGAGARTTTIDQSVNGLGVVGVATNTSAMIQGVTITGGKGTSAGGGIIDIGTLTLKNSAVTKNEADGYNFDFCPDPINGCPPPTYFPGVGGGIYAPGGGPLTIINSTISGNAANFGTGEGADGGGIYTSDPTTIINSTIADNTLDGGGFISDGGGIGMTGSSSIPLDLANDTLAFNNAGATSGVGGNIDMGGTGITGAIKNTVIADGSAGSGENCAGTMPPSAGYNLEDRNQCGFTRPTDLHTTDAKLGQPANHGGPTNTAALLPGSPAINAGNPQGCTDTAGKPISTDQRGVHRPQGTRCDIGAFEFRLAAVAGRPKIIGQPKPGNTLTCQLPAVQSPDGASTETVTWLAGAVHLGAGRTYRVRSADSGHPVRCQLVVADAAGQVVRMSAAVRIASPAKPSVTITLIDISGRAATFKFTAQRATSTQCALAKGPASAPFTSCTSPKHYRQLSKGSYVFYVRAIGPGGTSDPAQHSFKIS
jgi:hypothetical protein